MKNETLEQTQNIDGALPCAIKPPFVQTGAALPAVPANGISGSVLPVNIFASEKSAAGSPPAAAPHDGWEGTAFYINGKRYVVALSPEISKNGLHELRTYRFDGDKQAVPSEKLTTIVTEPLKQTESTRTMGAPADSTENNDKKCLFCGKSVTWGNKKTRYCSDGCRTAAYRQRKEAVAA